MGTYTLLKSLHCFMVVWYGNKFKSVRIATDTLTCWTITFSATKSGVKIVLQQCFLNISNTKVLKRVKVANK